VPTAIKQVLREAVKAGGRDTEKNLHGQPGRYCCVLDTRTKENTMHLDQVRLAYFSPTQTTKKVLHAVALGTGARVIDDDLTPLEARTRALAPVEGGMAVLGAPVYGGRIPQEAAIRLRRLQGNQTPAVVIVVYGNREYEDALLELYDLAVERGFRPVAAAAFIGEHSFSSQEYPIAGGRPDAPDLTRAEALGRQVASLLAAIPPEGDLPAVQVPGNRPYKEGGKPLGLTPATLEEQCEACGACADVCPTGAIAVNDAAHTDASLCIMCCACLRACPHNARVIREEGILQAAQRLSTTCSEPKQPEVFGVPALPD